MVPQWSHSLWSSRQGDRAELVVCVVLAFVIGIE
jgi:hypothetical protein